MKLSLPQKLTTPFILLFVVFQSFNQSLASSNPSTKSTDFIKQCCSTITYPKLCYATLLGYADQIHYNSKRLAAKSLVIALIEAKSVSQTTSRLSLARGLRPKEKSALSDCIMAAESSAAQLQRSIQEIGGAQAWNEMEASDVETWTSTALTYAGTCREAFEGDGMDGSVKMIVQRKIVKLSQLTSNALALVKRYYVSAARKAHHHVNHP